MGIDEIWELQLTFKEADMWLIPHIQWDVIHFLRAEGVTKRCDLYSIHTMYSVHCVYTVYNVHEPWGAIM